MAASLEWMPLRWCVTLSPVAFQGVSPPDLAAVDPREGDEGRRPSETSARMVARSGNVRLFINLKTGARSG